MYRYEVRYEAVDMGVPKTYKVNIDAHGFISDDTSITFYIKEDGATRHTAVFFIDSLRAIIEIDKF